MIPTQNNFDVSKDQHQETAKEWSYLQSIHAVYMILIEGIAKFTRNISFGSTNAQSSRADLKSRLHAATLMAYAHFKDYLYSNEEAKIDFNEYLDVCKEDVDDKKLLELCYTLIEWYQRYGYFKLINESYQYKDLFSQVDEENK